MCALLVGGMRDASLLEPQFMGGVEKMSLEAVEVQRPDRWMHPLSDAMNSEIVRDLLAVPPFSRMNQERFDRNTPLADILQHDCRLLQLDAGDFVFHEGQYGDTAYLVLDGDVRVFLSRFVPGQASRQTSKWSGSQWLSLIGKLPVRPRREKRKRPRKASAQVQRSVQAEIGYRGTGSETRIFLQDVPKVLSENATSTVSQGELFGELAAVTRSPREFTAIAENPCTVLEIRWQGLKLLKQDPAFRDLLDGRYRGEVLKTHLRETTLFRYLPEESLDQVVAAAKLESFGNLEWYAEYQKRTRQAANAQIEAEPLIAEEGGYATGAWIIRGGFARLSRRQGAGHRTLAYLGKGQVFGLRELVQNDYYSPNATPLPFQESLRAIGYVDAVCIPKQVVKQHVLPFIRQSDLPPPLHSPRYQFGQPVVDAALDPAEHDVETGLLEFLVDKRLMNGRKTMVIDMDRCTRCDDCVKACASTHGGTPVFVREGPQYEKWMFAESCMHCEDPVCMIGCPTGAIHRDHTTGLVKINEQTCIGCKTCAESCPYDNIRMIVATDGKGRAKVDEATGQPILQASKCDFCSNSGGNPACQAACPHDALFRIDMSDVAVVSERMGRRTG